MAISDSKAREVVLAAFASRGIQPQLAAVQIVQAIGKHESRYGVALGHHNWGAVHCVHGPPCRAGCFEAGDRNASGQGYRTCLRAYGSDVEGAADLIRELYRRPSVVAALGAGDVLAVARTMRETAYHETKPELYAKALWHHLQAIAPANGEAIAAQMGVPPPAAGAPRPQLSPAPPPRSPAGVPTGPPTGPPAAPNEATFWPIVIGGGLLAAAVHALSKTRNNH